MASKRASGTWLALALVAACSEAEPGGKAAPSTGAAAALGLLAGPGSARALDGALDLGRASALLGDGWRAPERHADGTTWSWMVGRHASFRLLVGESRGGSLFLRAAPLAGLGAEQRLRVAVNGHELALRALHPGEQLLEFPLPEGALQTGANQVELEAALCERPHEEPHGDLLSVKLDYAVVADSAGDPAELARRARAAAEIAETEGPLVLAPGELLLVPLCLPARSVLRLAAGGAGQGALEARLHESGGRGALLDRRVSAPGRLAELELDLDGIAGLAELLLCAAPGGPAVSIASAALLRQDEPLDVILVVVDTLRADAVSDASGAIATPAIDALAADGIRFEQACAHAPMTLPAHTALFASRPPHETGVWNNGERVGRTLPLLAESFARAGYATRAAISLSTLYPVEAQHGLDRGFGRYVCTDYDIAAAPRINAELWKLLDELERSRPFFLFAHYCEPHEPYEAHGTAERSAEIRVDGQLAARVGTSESTVWRQPWTLAPGEHWLEIASNDAFLLRHLRLTGAGSKLQSEFVEGRSWQPATKLRARIVNQTEDPVSFEFDLWLNDALSEAEVAQRYRLEVEFLDRHLAQLFGELRRRGLYEDALVVFTSDHGEALGEHGLVGHVETLYDELIRVPLIVKLPRGSAHRPALAARRAELVRHVDLAPTILELAGLPELPEGRGLSLLAAGPRLHTAETHPPEAKRTLVCLRDERYKLIHCADDGRFEMYDLAADPRELRDVFPTAGSERPDWPERLRALAARSQREPAAALDPAQRERLRALGYAGD